MSKALGMRCVWGLCGALASVLVLATATQGEVTSDLSGSVLVYPKVLYGPCPVGLGGLCERDTVIQLSNTGNNLVHAKCFYVNAQEVNGRPLWQVTDFELWLTKQQPVHWVASQGRQVNPFDSFPASDGSGLDPGSIPPVPPGFQGELKCVQLGPSGFPFGGNHLKGEAVLRSLDGDVSKYNAVAILATELVADDFELRLNNTPIEEGELNSCANIIMMDHMADGTPSSVAALQNPGWCPADTCILDTCVLSGLACTTDSDCLPPQCPIRPYLTVVPCQEDFENAIPETVTLDFEVINEFETPFSTSTSVTCWRQFRLADLDVGTGFCSFDASVSCGKDADCIVADLGFCAKPTSIFSAAVLGTASAYTRFVPAGLDGGVIAIGEEAYFVTSTGRMSDSAMAWAAWNLHQSGTRFEATRDIPGGPRIDKITIPQPF